MKPSSLIYLCLAALTAARGKTTASPQEDNASVVHPAPSPSTDPQCPAGDQWSAKASRCCRVCPAGSGATGPCATYTFTLNHNNHHHLTDMYANSNTGNEDGSKDTMVTTTTSTTTPPSQNTSGAAKEMFNDCESCVEGVTFSASHSSEQPCRTCSTCPKNARQVSACNVTHDTVCECKPEYFLDPRSGQCQLCALCPVGWGVQTLCGLANTACRMCDNGTFSDALSAIETCRPCSVCSEGQRKLQDCTATQDTFCIGKYMTIRPTPKGDDGGPYDFGEMGTRHKEPAVHDDDNGIDVIPLYCAALGAVVVGLLGYVAFVHYRRMRDKRMSREPHEDVEYSKASGADSGVFADVDHHHHNHHQQKYQSVMTGSTRLRDVSQNKRKELERTLLAGSKSPADWKTLARELGYNSGKIASFEPRNSRDPGAPYRHVLHDWSRLEGATIAAFLRALRNTGRHDVVKFLQAECSEQLQPLTSTLPQHIV